MLHNVTLKNVKLVFRNLGGRPSQYNAAGRRNFAIVLDKATAKGLISDGWNVKRFRQRDEDVEPDWYLPVEVRYGRRNPTIVLLKSNGRVDLDEDTVDILDYCDLEFADVVVRPYEWEVNGKKGVKAYCKTLFATLDEDELERKYASVPKVDDNREDEDRDPWDSRPLHTDIDEEVPF